MATTPHPSSDSASIKTFLKQQARRASRLLRVASGAALASGALLVAGAWYLSHAVNAVMFEDASQRDILMPLLAVLGIYALRAILIFLAEYAGANAALQVKTAMRQELLGALSCSPATSLHKEQTGSLITSLGEGLDAMHGYYARYLPSMSVTALLPLTILFFVFPVDWVSGLIMLVTAPLIPLFMILIGRGAERLNQAQWQKLSRMGGHFLDVIQGLTTLKLFNASKREGEAISLMCDAYRHDTMAILRVAFLSSLALEFFATVSIALVAVLVGFRLLWGNVDFDNAYLVLLLAPEFYLPLRRMGAHYHARMEAIGAAEKIAALLSEERHYHTGTKRPAPRAPRITFNHVCFSYQDGIPVLDDVSFTIESGEKWAIIGPTGCGKSTILGLLLGFLTPQSGSIHINDVPLNEIALQEWWKTIGWVAARPQFVAGDVASNIRIGNPDISNTALEVLAHRMGIAALYQPVGEAGKGLSGGQLQRVAMARALARNAECMLMDEPTSHLDYAAEHEVMQAWKKYVATATCLVVSHRMQSLDGFDGIIALKAGRIERVERRHA